MSLRYERNLVYLHGALGSTHRDESDPVFGAPHVLAATSFQSLGPLPNPKECAVSEALAKTHFLRNIISQCDPITAAQYKMLAADLNQFDELKLLVSQSGAIPAATSAQTHYAFHSWARDTAIIALAASECGEVELANAAVRQWLEFYAEGDQRAKFAGLHLGPNPVTAYSLSHMQPHIIAEIASDGTLEEREKPWGHQQLESPAWIALSAFRFANQGKLDLDEINQSINRRERISGQGYNHVESVLPLILKTFLRIEFWNQSDLGVWEDNLQHRRATSIAVVVAALEEARRYFDTHGWDSMAISYDGKSRAESARAFKEEVERGIERGWEVLRTRIPEDPGAWARECDRPDLQHDLSLMLLLYPLRMDLSERQRDAIYRTVFSNMGEIGFVRRWQDAYVGQDYIHAIDHPWGEGFAFMDVPGYRPAEWTIADPTLATTLAEESVSKRDYRRFLIADRLMKRSLSHITSDDVAYRFAGPRQEAWLPQEVVVPRGSLPEAYFMNRGVETANHNYSLLWSVAMQARAMHAMTRAARYWQPLTSGREAAA